MSEVKHLCRCHKCGYEEYVWKDDEDYGYVPECKTKGCSNYGQRIYDIEDLYAFSDNPYIQDWMSYEVSREEYRNYKQILFDRLKDILKWENENLGKKHEVLPGSDWQCISIEKEPDFLWFSVEEFWAYGGHDSQEISIPYYKFFSDEWKEKALEEYRLSKEKEKEEKAKKKLEKDRADYEKLKKQFEG